MTVEDAGMYADWMYGFALADDCGLAWCSWCARNWLDVEAANVAYDVAVAAQFPMPRLAEAAP